MSFLISDRGDRSGLNSISVDCSAFFLFSLRIYLRTVLRPESNLRQIPALWPRFPGLKSLFHPRLDTHASFLIIDPHPRRPHDCGEIGLGAGPDEMADIDLKSCLFVTNMRIAILSSVFFCGGLGYVIYTYTSFLWIHGLGRWEMFQETSFRFDGRYESCV